MFRVLGIYNFAFSWPVTYLKSPLIICFGTKSFLTNYNLHKNKLFLSEEDVVRHFKKFHPDVEGVVCPHCCKLLSKKCTLNRHIEQVHLGLQIFKPAKCQECGKVFSKKGHLDRHVRTIHMGMKDESEPCPHCGKIFTTKSSLEPHIEAVHKGKVPGVCGRTSNPFF